MSIPDNDNMQCKTCVWFQPEYAAVGKCRRHAPAHGNFPKVLLTEWCGDHTLSGNMKRQVMEHRLETKLETLDPGSADAKVEDPEFIQSAINGENKSAKSVKEALQQTHKFNLWLKKKMTDWMRAA